MGKGGSGLRSRRGERSGYVGPFDHPKKEQKTAESPLQRRVARRVQWRGCGNRRFVRGILRRVPIQFKKVWTYLYRAVNSEGNTLEFLLSSTRDAEAAKRFFLKALPSPADSAPQAHPFEEQVAEPPSKANPVTPTPRIINVDNAAYPRPWRNSKPPDSFLSPSN